MLDISCLFILYSENSTDQVWDTMICLNACDKGKRKKKFSNFQTTFSQVGINGRSVTNIYSTHTSLLYILRMCLRMFLIKKKIAAHINLKLCLVFKD